MAVGNILEADDPVENFEQQENITLGHQTGQDCAGGNRGITVSIRHPGMEGEQGRLNGQAHRDDADGDQHGNPVGSCCHDGGDLLLNILHQQMARQIIEHTDAHQQQTGTQQAHDHVTDRCLNAAAVLTNHDQTAGGNGIDLHEHVGREQVVGIHQGQQRTHQQVAEDVVDIMLGGFHFPIQLFPASQQRQQHDNAEEQGHSGFQNTNTNLIAPGSGEMAHHVGVAADIGFHNPCQEPAGHDRHGAEHCRIQPTGIFSRQHRRNGA